MTTTLTRLLAVTGLGGLSIGSAGVIYVAHGLWAVLAWFVLIGAIGLAGVFTLA